jgi:putative peptide zinc metalloprotease protein
LTYIICPQCKYLTLADDMYCKHCGLSLPGNAAPDGQSPELVIVYSGGKSRKETSFNLPSTITTIGRTDENTIVLFDDEVSRHHAAIFRDPDGRYCIEDLRSTNGTFLNGRRISTPTPIASGDEVWIGKSILQLEVSTGVVAADSAESSLESEDINTDNPPTQRAFVALDMGQIHNPSFRPIVREGCSLRYMGDEDDNYILKNPKSPAIKKLNKRGVYMWKLMDGEHTLFDIFIEYMIKFRASGADRLIDIIDELTEKGFLQNAASRQNPTGSSDQKTEGEEAENKRISGPMQLRFPVPGFDDWLTKIYTRFAWRFYTRTGQFILGAIGISGFIALLFILYQNDYSLFRVQDSFILGYISLALVHMLTIFLHKFGHALTVKSYHRRVRQAGFMLDHGLPTIFVDTSDIWLEPKAARVQTFMSGVYTNFLVGSITALVMLVVDNKLVNSVLFQIAAWSNIIALVNLNPLFDLDGYYTLMDMMEIPQLRKRSWHFIRHELFQKLLKKETFSKDETCYAIYGSLCGLWILIAARIIFIYIRPYLFRK